MGFPFSNFYLPSRAAAIVCRPVNLPITEHSVLREVEFVFTHVCVCVCHVRLCTLHSSFLYLLLSLTTENLWHREFMAQMNKKTFDCRLSRFMTAQEM